MWYACQATDHQVAHGHTNHGFARLGQILVTFREAAVEIKSSRPCPHRLMESVIWWWIARSASCHSQSHRWGKGDRHSPSGAPVVTA
jgi:hypothetical protein